MVTIDWGTSVIKVPKEYMPVIQVSPEVRELDVNAFRLDLKALEASVEGMPFQKTHNHITEYIISGITYARAVEILEPYTVEFEDGQYTVSLVGANNNVLDRKVPNNVSVLGNNSGGLIVTEGVSQTTVERIENLVDELHKLQGLNKDHPMTVTPTTRSVDDIDQTISGDGENVTVVTRT